MKNNLISLFSIVFLFSMGCDKLYSQISREVIKQDDNFKLFFNSIDDMRNFVTNPKHDLKEIISSQEACEIMDQDVCEMLKNPCILKDRLLVKYMTINCNLSKSAEKLREKYNLSKDELIEIFTDEVDEDKFFFLPSQFKKKNNK